MFWRRRNRLNEEVDTHLAAETADNIARGMDPVSARHAALRTFGNVGAAKERARELDPLYWLDTFSQDVRFAFRLIARNRWASAAIVATLTLGIGLNVSVFSLLNVLMLRPWVRTDAATFVTVVPRYSGQYRLRYSTGGLSQLDYALYRDSAKSLESLGALRMMRITMSAPESGSVRAVLVSCNVFHVMRAGPPLVGRYFSADECARPMDRAVVVLGEATWRGAYGADAAIVGRTVHLNRIPFTVIGVAPAVPLPAGGIGPDSDAAVWVPYTLLQTLRPADDYFAAANAHWLTVVGRRHPEYSQAQVQEELGALARHADESVPGRVTSLHVTDGSLAQDPEMRGKAAIIFSVTLGTTILLLLLACVNVTTLLLSRSAARQREIAVRLSLGAGRFRLLRQLFTESMVLSGLAGAFSMFVAYRAPAALWRSVMAQEPPFDLIPDWRVLLFGLALALVAGAIAGLSPAVESLRPALSESLKGSAATTTSSPRRSRLRGVLVAVQIALSLLLLLQAGLFTRAHRRLFSYDPGFETRQVLSVTFASVLAGYSPPAAFYRELESRARALPGVVDVSYVSIAPWSGRNSTELAEIDGQPLPPTRDFRRDPARRMVSAEYFAILDIPLTRGRAFRRDEQPSKGEVIPVVISEAMARRYWPDQDPLGRRFRTSAVHEVIGVSRDTQSVAFMQDDGPFYYSPLDQQLAKPPSLLVRVAGDTQASAAALREIVRQLDPQMASTLATLASTVEEQADRLKPVMIYGAAAGVLALLLALTGVYGVVSFSVSQRIPEIGIRMALGAQRGDVMALVFRSGVAPICGGLAAGVALALGAAAAMEATVLGITPRDPMLLTAVALLLLGAALCAIWIPARRAARLQPLSSLRYE